MFNKKNKTQRKTAGPMVENLEGRQLMSAAPLSYDGQYVMYQNTTRYEVDFKRDAGTATNYTGDVKQGSIDLKLTAVESNNRLTGAIREASGKLDQFTASLSGRTLTLGVGSAKVVYQKRVQPLSTHTAGAFQFDMPAGWTARANTGGMLIKSADGSQQVAIASGVYSGYLAPKTMITYAQNHGTTLLLAKSSPLYNLGGGLWSSYEVAEVGFRVGNTAFTSDVVIASVYNANYGVTKIGMASIAAPTANFAKNGAVMVDILTSIRQLPFATARAHAVQPAASAAQAVNTAAAAPAVIGNWVNAFDYGYTFTNGFYDPGVLGNWASGYTTAWVSPFVAAEQVYIAQSSSAFDAQVLAWHEQFNAD